MMTVIWQHKMADLRTYISDRSSAAALQTATGEASLALAGAAARIATVIREPEASADFAAARGSANADGDIQKALDVICDEIVAAALSAAGVATYLSEEREDPVPMNDDGLVIVACDPLDGSSNIDTNLSIGTIFSCCLQRRAAPAGPQSACLRLLRLWPANHSAIDHGTGCSRLPDGFVRRISFAGLGCQHSRADIRICHQCGQFPVLACASRCLCCGLCRWRGWAAWA